MQTSWALARGSRPGWRPLVPGAYSRLGVASRCRTIQMSCSTCCAHAGCRGAWSSRRGDVGDAIFLFPPFDPPIHDPLCAWSTAREPCHRRLASNPGLRRTHVRRCRHWRSPVHGYRMPAAARFTGEDRNPFTAPHSGLAISEWTGRTAPHLHSPQVGRCAFTAWAPGREQSRRRTRDSQRRRCSASGDPCAAQLFAPPPDHRCENRDQRLIPGSSRAGITPEHDWHRSR